MTRTTTAWATASLCLLLAPGCEPVPMEPPTTSTDDAGIAADDAGETPPSPEVDAAPPSPEADAGPSTTDLDTFIRTLPSWIEVSPVVSETNEPVAEAVLLPDEPAADGTLYRCTTTTYELGRNPTDIAMASPDAAVIWPGALLRGEAHLERGATELLAVRRERRAPIGLSLQGGGVLGIRGGVSTVVEQPIGSTVREGINQLVANAIESDVATGAGASSYQSVETHSTEQALLELGFDARYLGASVDAAFRAEREVDQHTLTATFVQRLFTASVDAPESPSDMFAPEVSAMDLQALGVGPDNLPVYIDSVSYGRTLMVSLTSTDSIEQMQAALTFAYEGVVAAGSLYTDVELRETLSSASIEVFALGGPNAGVEALIASGQLAAYFDGSFAINQVEPISFTVRNLGDNRVASVGSTTRYERERCEEVLADLPEPDHWWRMDGDLRDSLGAAPLLALSRVDYSTGLHGMAVALSGDDVRAYDSAQPISRTGAFTLSAWVRPSATGVHQTIAALVSTDRKAGDFQVRLTPDNALELFRRPAGSSDAFEIVATAAGAVPAGRWTHVTAVYGVGPESEGPLRIYVDGVFLDGRASPTSYSVLSNREGFVLGQADGTIFGGRFLYSGAIDEMMVFDRALSTDEVSAHFARFPDYFAP